MGALALVADGPSGLRVIDVSNPAAPVEAGASGAHPAFSVAWAGGLAYVAAGDDGLRILDVADPALPFELGAWNASSHVHPALDHVELAGELAYVSHASSVRAIDVSNPAEPVERGGFPADAADPEVVDGLVYLASGGLRILDFGPEYASVIPVEIDVKPGNGRNAVNPKSRGVAPVAILGSESFDAAEIDPATLAFGPGGAGASQPGGGHLRDVNGDGFVDLATQFRVAEAGIAPGDGEICVRGETRGGIPFEGCDALARVPSRGPPSRAHR